MFSKSTKNILSGNAVVFVDFSKGSLRFITTSYFSVRIDKNLFQIASVDYTRKYS